MILCLLFCVSLLAVPAFADADISVALSGDSNGVSFFYGTSMYTYNVYDTSKFSEVDLTCQTIGIQSSKNCALKMTGELSSLVSICIGSYTINISEFCSENSVDLTSPATASFGQVTIKAANDPTTAAKMGMTDGSIIYGYIVDKGQNSCFAVGFNKITTNDDFSLSLTFASGSQTTIDVSSIALDRDNASVAVGGTFTLAATVLPENATDPTVTWTSSDDSIATVSGGVVTGVSAGTATITAAAGDKSATCAVTVTAAPAPGPEISITEVSGTPIADVTSTVENGTATLHVTAATPCVVIVKKADDTYERLEAVKNGDSYDFSQSGYTSDMEFHVLLKGDANGDGIVSTDDAMQLARACLSTTHTAYLTASELNQAAYGAITTDLAMQIARSCLSSDHVAYQALTW